VPGRRAGTPAGRSPERAPPEGLTLTLTVTQAEGASSYVWCGILPCVFPMPPLVRADAHMRTKPNTQPQLRSAPSSIWMSKSDEAGGSTSIVRYVCAPASNAYLFKMKRAVARRVARVVAALSSAIAAQSLSASVSWNSCRPFRCHHPVVAQLFRRVGLALPVKTLCGTIQHVRAVSHGCLARVRYLAAFILPLRPAASLLGHPRWNHPQVGGSLESS